jgi:hypothetical protein
VAHRSLDLKSFLDRYKYSPGLAVHWIFVGPSGRKKRPTAGGVLRAYDQCSPKARSIFKTIANAYFISGVSDHPHNFWYRCARPFAASRNTYVMQRTPGTSCRRLARAAGGTRKGRRCRARTSSTCNDVTYCDVASVKLPNRLPAAPVHGSAAATPRCAQGRRRRC